MNMGSVCVSCYKECMLSLGESHGCFIAYTVRFLRGNLSRLKGLTDLISNDITGVTVMKSQIFTSC